MAYDREEQPAPITDAIARLGGALLASPNRYWVAFTLPGGVAGGDGVAALAKSGQPQKYSRELGDIGFMCTAMSFPGRSVMTVDSRHIGTPFKIPYSAAYTDVAFTFHLSADFRERKYFEIWQQCVVNVNLNSMNFYKEYVMPVQLMKLDNQNKVTYQVNLVEAYPLEVGEVQSSFAANDEISTCTVTMAYKHWYNEDIQ